MKNAVGRRPFVERPGSVEGVDGVALRLVHVGPHRHLGLCLHQLVVRHVAEGDHLWNDVAQENLRILGLIGKIGRRKKGSRHRSVESCISGEAGDDSWVKFPESRVHGSNDSEGSVSLEDVHEAGLLHHVQEVGEFGLFLNFLHNSARQGPIYDQR